jgi:hypothetical protein
MNAPTANIAHIVEADSGVPESYQHEPKLVMPGAAIEACGATLKWYALHPEAEPVPEAVALLARTRVTTAPLAARGLGFVLLHRCEKDFYFLIVCTWRNCNELWETVFYKDGPGMQFFELFPREAAHKPVFCVWELPRCGTSNWRGGAFLPQRGMCRRRRPGSTTCTPESRRGRGSSVAPLGGEQCLSLRALTPIILS